MRTRQLIKEPFLLNILLLPTLFHFQILSLYYYKYISFSIHIYIYIIFCICDYVSVSERARKLQEPMTNMSNDYRLLVITLYI